MENQNEISANEVMNNENKTSNESKSKNKIKEFFKTSWNDIVTMKWYEWLIVSVAAVFLVIMSLYSFSEKTWIWKTYAVNGHTWKQTIAGLSGFAAWTGIMCVFMVSKGKMSNYIFGFVNVLLYGMYAFSVGYTGDAILNLFFYLPMQFVGAYMWSRHLNKKTVLNNKVNWKSITLTLVSLGVLWVAFFYAIPSIDQAFRGAIMHDNDPYVFKDDATMRTVLGHWGISNVKIFKGQALICHLLDSFTNAASVVGTVLMLKRYKEQWIIWISVNIAQITMYAGLNGQGASPVMLIMWGVFMTNSIYGFYQWRKREKENKRLIEEDIKESNSLIDKIKK